MNNPYKEYIRLAREGGFEDCGGLSLEHDTFLVVDKGDYFAVVSRDIDEENMFLVAHFYKEQKDYDGYPHFEGTLQECFAHLDREEKFQKLFDELLA